MVEKVENKKPWSLCKKIFAACVTVLVMGLMFVFYYFILAYPSAFGVLGLLAKEFHRL